MDDRKKYVFIDGDGTGRKYKTLTELCKRYSVPKEWYKKQKKEGRSVKECLNIN